MLLTLQFGRATLAVESAGTGSHDSVWLLLSCEPLLQLEARPRGLQSTHQKAYDSAEHPDWQNGGQDEIDIQVSDKSRQANFT